MKFRSKDEAPTAYPDKLLIIDAGSWKYQKPVLDRKKCSHCGMCFFFCPTGCISQNNGELVTNLDYCKGCGTCAKTCTRGAIAMVTEGVK